MSEANVDSIEQIKQRHKKLLGGNIADMYVEELGMIWITDQGTIDDKSFNRIRQKYALLGGLEFFNLIKDPGAFSEKDVPSLLGCLASLCSCSEVQEFIDTMPPILRNKQRYLIYVAHRIGQLPKDKYTFSLKGTEKGELEEALELAKALIAAFSSVTEETLRPVAVSGLVHSIAVLEMIRALPETLPESEDFERGKAWINNRMLEICQEYGIDPLLIETANQLTEQVLSEIKQEEREDAI